MLLLCLFQQEYLLFYRCTASFAQLQWAAPAFV